MDIIIKLQPERYETIRRIAELKGQTFSLERIITEGKILPKGHGRLIDVDRLYDDFESMDYDFEDAIEYAPTIIEADKESEDKEKWQN